MRKYSGPHPPFMPAPPGYTRASAGYDRFCRVCIFYDNGHCKSYNVPVDRDFTCLTCVRNYSISAEQASSMLSG